MSAQARSSHPEYPISLTARKAGGFLYVFAVCMADQSTEATLTPSPPLKDGDIEVIGENRLLKASAGSIKDRFGPWEVHLYKIKQG